MINSNCSFSNVTVDTCNLFICSNNIMPSMNKSHTLPNWYCMSLKELKNIQHYNSIHSYYRKGPIRTPKGNEILFELAGVWDSWVGVEFLHIFEQDIKVILVHFEEIICLSTDYDLVCTIFGHRWLQSVISTVRNVALREEFKIHVADSKLMEKTLQYTFFSSESFLIVSVVWYGCCRLFPDLLFANQTKRAKSV